MRFRLNTFIYQKCRIGFFPQNRHYAGHSKWQNIKADKQSQDAAKSQLFKSLSSKMRVIAKETGNPDPAFNSKLASLVDQAKKANMPASTLNNILEKLKGSDMSVTVKPQIIIVSAPSSVIMILYLATDKVNVVKTNINHILRKFNSKLADASMLNSFDCASYIKASKDCTLDQAMENAIEADAEDVEEAEHDDQMCFKFRSTFLFPDKTLTQLQNLGYSILSTENKCIPNNVVELNEQDMQTIQKLKKKLFTDVQEITKIEDNIVS